MKRSGSCGIAVGVLCLLSGTMFGGCNRATDKTETIISPEEIERYEEFEVDRDTVADTIYHYGALRLKGVEVSRLVSVDSLDAYLSVRFQALRNYPTLNRRLFDLVDSFYTSATMQSPSYRRIGSSSSVVEALDALSRNYRDSIILNSADSLIYYPGQGIAIDVRPVYATNRFVTYSLFFYNFVGGSRPETDWIYATFPLGGGDSYKLKDIVKPEARGHVLDILLNDLASELEMSVDDYVVYLADWLKDGSDIEDEEETVEPSREQLTDLRREMTDSLAAMSRAALTEEGIVFSFPRYSIGPAFDAIPQFVVPLDSLAESLKFNIKD